MSRTQPLHDPYALPHLSAAEARAYEEARSTVRTEVESGLVILLVSMGGSGSRGTTFGPNFAFAVASRDAADTYMRTHTDLAIKTYPFSLANLELVKKSPQARQLFAVEGDLAGGVWQAKLRAEARLGPTHDAHCSCPGCHTTRSFLH